MITNCNIIRDLIPLVKDDVASEESKAMVLSHIQECEPCRALYDSQPAPPETDTAPQPGRDAKILLAVRRSIRTIQALLLTVGGIIGISIGLSAGMFYNILLMPLLGILSGIGTRIRWYLVPLIVFAGELPWYLGYTWLTEGLQAGIGSILAMGAVWGLIYAVLILLGRAAAELFRFAFNR